MAILESKSIMNLKEKNQTFLNEIEYVDGFIYANIFLERKIIKIDYEEGKVIAEYDALLLLKE